MSSEYKYEDHWPMRDINLYTITGAMESGKDLFLIGAFGGFGGCIHYVHSNLERAKIHAQQINNKNIGFHVKIYRMKFELEDEMIERQKTEG